MNKKINRLPKEVSLLIAAGEVIENPLSIIKELVENSIDADSKIIRIEIVDGGKKHISINDDGLGIDPDEIEIAFERHATSKLKNKEEINSIDTLGFRGEALASIASVSHIKCTSRVRSNDFAQEIEILHGKTIKNSKTGSNYGTKIIIEKIFENTPARLKFLSSNRSEASKIQNFINGISQSYPFISFELSIDGKTKLKTNGDNELFSVIADFYKISSNDLIKINSNNENLQISGYISKPQKSFGNRSRMNIFVNNRIIQNTKIMFAIENAYRPFISHKKFPIISINITVPLNMVDVNVHPQKHEVKFSDENEILSFIYNSISKLLNQEIPANTINILDKSTHEISNFENNGFLQESLFDNEGFSLKDSLPILRFIGQIKNTFLICEGPDGIYIIDQHAAHERILFEKYKQQKSSREFQKLNIKKFVDLGIILNSKIIENIERFTELGWELEESATGQIIVRNIPFIGLYKTKESDVNFILDLISKDLEKKTSDTPKDIISKRLACHSAVRAGDSLTSDECIKLIKDLEKTDIPWDPHGRPAVIKLDYGNISNQFGR
ncbi:MAG: DNA mismatch repair endonuclease MutL [Chloroflexota bacterium]|nr:DNA mismatch repair endonuclease MutL [Chloroflexota bacterium]